MFNFKDYIIDQAIQTNEPENFLDEKMTWEWKTRNGKKTKKWHTDRKNYRIQINKKTGQPKEVYISPMERLKRKIGQKKAALKRKSKQKNITAKRLKSFGVRRKTGMKYNTAGHSSKKQARSIRTYDPYHEYGGLHPNMYESQLLLEWPHIEVLPELYWDFYEECGANDGTWLMPLVSLYKDHKLVSMKSGEEDDNNRETGDNGVYDLSTGELERITYNLCRDTWFINHARDGYKKLSQEDRDLFDLFVDERLLYKILNNYQ